MNKERLKQIRRNRRRCGIRKRVLGTAEHPRLSVYRSLNHMYAQLIDDRTGRTVTSASTIQAKVDKGGNVEAAKQVGIELARKAKAVGIEHVAFDRNGFRYHGRVKALAEAAREGGLKF